MTPEQERAYEERLAELDRELEAAIEDWKKYPIKPLASRDTREAEPSTQQPCVFDSDAVATTNNEV